MRNDYMDSLEFPTDKQETEKVKYSKSFEEIFNWFFSLDTDEQMKTISITNNNLTKNIIRMQAKFQMNQTLIFRLKFDNSLIDLNYIEKFEYKNVNERREFNDENMSAHLFLKEIVFYSLNEENDTVSLSPELIKDKRLLKYYFTIFSKEKVFENLCQVVYHPNFKGYICEYPLWFNKKEYYSLCEIIVAFFEMELNLKYMLSKSSNKKMAVINGNTTLAEINQKKNDFFDKRRFIKNFIKNLDKRETIADKIDLKGIIASAIEKNEQDLESSRKNHKKYFMNSKNVSFKLFEPPKEIDPNVLYEKYSIRLDEDRDNKIVNEYSFMTFEKLNGEPIDGIIESMIFEELYKYFSEKECLDLINEFQEENNKKKSSKGKKKKKKKKEKVEDNIEDNKQVNELSEKIEKVELKEEEQKDNNNIEIKNESEEKILSSITSQNDEKEIVVKSKRAKRKKDKSSNTNTKNNNIPKTQNQISTTSTVIKEEDTPPIKPELLLSQKEIKYLHQNYYNQNNFKEITISKISKPKTNKELLHNIILKTSNSIISSLISIKDIKYTNILFLCNKIKQCFSSDLSLFIYGSYSTGTAINSSDIDISITLLSETQKEKTLEQLITDIYLYLSKIEGFENLNPITTASVPILKLIINSETLNTSSNTKNSPIDKTKVDLTFNLPNPRQNIDYNNSKLKQYPEIKPLFLILKRLIKKSKLNSVFDGGLSSHSLFLMITSYIMIIKTNTHPNLGDILIDLLHFYGNFFKYTNTIIDITMPNPYIVIHEGQFTVPMIIDPISKNNVSKSSFNFRQIQELFSSVHSRLTTSTESIEKIFNSIVIE